MDNKEIDKNLIKNVPNWTEEFKEWLRKTSSEINERHHREWSKFMYYIIALCVAGIGFSITQTMNDSLSWSQIPLGLSVLCFAVCIYVGIKRLEFSMKALGLKQNQFRAMLGEKDFGSVKFNSDKSVYDVQKFYQELENRVNDLAKPYAKRHMQLFYAGVALFVIWRVVEMSLAIPAC